MTSYNENIMNDNFELEVKRKTLGSVTHLCRLCRPTFKITGDDSAGLATRSESDPR